MPDPQPWRAWRRRPALLSRVGAHLVVVGSLAVTSAFGVASAPFGRGGQEGEGSGPAPAPALEQGVSIVGLARAADEPEPVPSGLTLEIDPQVEARPALDRAAGDLEAADATPSPAPERAVGEVTAPPPGVPPAPPPGDPTPAPIAALAWPVAGGEITQYFHSGHLAVDIAAPYGTPAVSAAPGVVTYAGWANNGGGFVVTIDHGNGVVTSYNHLGGIWVGYGAPVAAGQAIGAVGCTGICTGSHLHFEVFVSGTPVNPLRFL